MKIQEVIESGKDFRRKGWKIVDYYIFLEDSLSMKFKGYGDLHNLTKEKACEHYISLTDLLAGDWEIKKSDPIKLTWEQVLKSLWEFREELIWESGDKEEVEAKYKKILGFED